MSRAPRWVAVVVVLFAAAVAPAKAAAADITSVGPQVRLTRVGPDGDTTFSARDPAIAYNTRDNEMMVAWTGRDPRFGGIHILGQIFDATGAPRSAVLKLDLVSDTASPAQPVVGYSPVVNQYFLAYIAPPPTAPNNPAGQREVLAQVVTATGAPSGSPFRVSDTDPGNADADTVSDLAMAYDSKRDQFRMVWIADEVEGDNEVFSRRVTSSLVVPGGFPEVSVSSTAAGIADAPSIAYLPAEDRFAFAWEGATGVGETEVFAEVWTGETALVKQEAAISASSGTADAFLPSVAASTKGAGFIVAFIKNDVVPAEGPEVFIQRFDGGGNQVPNANDQRISTMGPAGNVAFGASTAFKTTATYHPGLDRYLVTWAADNDLPGLVDNEIERYGQAIDPSGNELGADDFRISTAGPDGNDNASAQDGATLPIVGRRVWAHVWEGDDNRPPLADNEFEIYGRLAGDDGDLDGFAAPEDCNDGNPSIRPGAIDVADNGIDEDCSGADTENLDRDQDGAQRPADCDDANGAIRPGATDIAGNGVDEDCSGADSVPPPTFGPIVKPAPGRVTVTLAFGFPSAASSTKFTLLQVKGVPSGSTVVATCKGGGCPTKKVKGKKQNVVFTKKNASGTVSLKPFLKRSLRAGVVLTVTVTKPGSFGMVKKLTVKKNKRPTLSTSCLQPDSKAKAACEA